MTSNQDTFSSGNRHKGVGVSGYGPPKAIYSPSKHNPAAPIRPGAEDALQCPSLDHTGKRRAYWALKE